MASVRLNRDCAHRVSFAAFALPDLLQAAQVRASFDTRRGFAAALLRMRLDCLWHEQYSSS